LATLACSPDLDPDALMLQFLSVPPLTGTVSVGDVTGVSAGAGLPRGAASCLRAFSPGAETPHFSCALAQETRLAKESIEFRLEFVLEEDGSNAE